MDGARYLDDGRLTIFKRSGIYYARLRTSGSAKYLWRSLKTTNEQTAIDLGRRLLFQIEQRAEQGLPAKSKLFDAVVDDYIAYRERDHAHGRTSAGMLREIRRVSKFWRDQTPLGLSHSFCFSAALFPSELFDRSSKRSPPFGKSRPVLLSFLASSLAAASRKP